MPEAEPITVLLWLIGGAFLACGALFILVWWIWPDESRSSRDRAVLRCNECGRPMTDENMTSVLSSTGWKLVCWSCVL